MARLRFGRPISLRWNGLLLEGPANTVFEIPDEFYEEFNQDIGTVEPTIVWLDADEAATLRGRVTALEGAGAGAPLSTATPLALGTAAVGTETASSHGDHVHPTTGLALSGHNHDANYSATAHNHSGVYELSGAVSTHEAAGDPHPGYLTETSASSTYATSGHNHSGTYEPVNTAILKTIVDAKGDIIVGTAADTVSRLAVSATNGHVLSADSTAATGLAWVAQSGGGGGASLSDTNALALGTAAPGVAATASRYDHVHPTTGVSLTGHNHDAAYSPLGSEGRADIVYELCQNSSGGTIPAYSVVYVDGANGTNPTIALADADTEATSSKTLGFTETSSANGDTVTVITQGRLTGVDTSAASAEGASVWLSGTAGGYVFGSPPSEPAHSVYLGVVTKKNPSTGEIFVKVQNGYELDELHNVSAASPNDGDLIQYVSSTGLWTKKSISAAGISATHSHPYEASGAVSAHNAATTSVHGISNTANLLTNTHVDTDVATTSLHHTIGTTATTAAAGNHGHATLAPIASPTFTGSVTTPLTTAGYVKTTSGGLLSSSAAVPQADVTSLTTDLAAKAPLASPTFTGTVTTPLTTAGVVKTSSGGVLSSVAALANTDLANSAITINGTSVSLGGTATVSASLDLTINAATLTSNAYTLLLTDKDDLVEMSSASANTLNIPLNASVAFPVGSQVHVLQTGAGQTTIAGISGVTVNSALGLKLRAQWSSVTLIKRATNTWVAIGDLSA